MNRFVIKEDEDEDAYDDWGNPRDVLLDTKTNRVVYYDGGEPEDMTLTRNLDVFVNLLNELADELEAYKNDPD